MSKELTERMIEFAYDNYADSHWTPPEMPPSNDGLLGPQLWGLVPMQHSLASFTVECRKNKKFYKKYTKKYPAPYNSNKKR